MLSPIEIKTINSEDTVYLKKSNLLFEIAF